MRKETFKTKKELFKAVRNRLADGCTVRVSSSALTWLRQGGFEGAYTLHYRLPKPVDWERQLAKYPEWK